MTTEVADALDYDRAHFDPDAKPVGVTDGERPKYVYREPIVLAVNVALATQRPLLVAGPPGSGKTTLARHVAYVKGWRYLEKVVTSRTQVDDLISEFDALRRLNDANIRGRKLKPDAAYVNPGVLWWAFDRESAAQQGPPQDEQSAEAPGSPTGVTDSRAFADTDDVVVLLDEIDKADPDVPNDILEPLDRRSFTLRQGETVAAKGRILMVITTNGERDLPPAFVRRCVLLTLGEMTTTRLIEIARLHFGPENGSKLYERIAAMVEQLAKHAKRAGLRVPSTAEYIDTIRACRSLKATGDTAEHIAALALAKEGMLVEALLRKEATA